MSTRVVRVVWVSLSGLSLGRVRRSRGSESEGQEVRDDEVMEVREG